jgi:hypothetical protein
MIEENASYRHSSNFPLSADDALKEFRESTIMESPPTSTINDENILSVPVLKVEQEIQTDEMEYDK